MIVATENGLELRVVMTIAREWKNVDRLRTAILNCVEVIVGEGDASATVSTIVSELLENAIKYGEWSDQEQSVLRLQIAGNTEVVRIDVSSPSAPSSKNYVDLVETLAWIRSFPNPEDAYMERVRQVASDESALSRMGLVRIACEGPCTLDAHLDAENMLVTTAITHVSPRSRSGVA